MSRIRESLRYAGTLPLKATGLYAGVEVFKTRYSSDEYSTALHVDMSPFTTRRDRSTLGEKCVAGAKAVAVSPLVAAEAVAYSAIQAITPTFGRLVTRTWVRDDTYPRETHAAETVGFLGTGAGLAADVISTAVIFSHLPNPITSVVAVLGAVGLKMLVNLGEQVNADVVDAVATKIDNNNRRRLS